MAEIGKPLRKINVQPEKQPEKKRTVNPPAPAPAKEKEKEKVPA